MTYFNANPALEPVTRILCDDCAETEVPFSTHTYPDGEQHRQQDRPWRWAPSYGVPCHACASDC